jgi:hypothetical protein
LQEQVAGQVHEAQRLELQVVLQFDPSAQVMEQVVPQLPTPPPPSSG